MALAQDKSVSHLHPHGKCAHSGLQPHSGGKCPTMRPEAHDTMLVYVGLQAWHAEPDASTFEVNNKQAHAYMDDEHGDCKFAEGGAPSGSAVLSAVQKRGCSTNNAGSHIGATDHDKNKHQAPHRTRSK
eukprot:4403533-Alexandrium_andersonii.AAC.1